MSFQKHIPLFMLSVGVLASHSYINSNPEEYTRETLNISIGCSAENNPFVIPSEILKNRLQSSNEIQTILKSIQIFIDHPTDYSYSLFDSHSLFARLGPTCNKIFFINATKYHPFFESNTYTIPAAQFLQNRAILLNNDIVIKALADYFAKYYIVQNLQEDAYRYLFILDSILMENALFRKLIVDNIIESRVLETIQQPLPSKRKYKYIGKNGSIKFFEMLIRTLVSYSDIESLNRIAMAIEDSMPTADTRLLGIMIKYYPIYAYSKENARSLITGTTRELSQHSNKRYMHSKIPSSLIIEAKDKEYLFRIQPIKRALIQSNSYQQLTISQKHFLWYQYHIVEFLNGKDEYQNALVDNGSHSENSHFITMIHNVLKNEHMLLQQGKYVFYHAQQWSLYFLEDLYTKLWEIKYQQSVCNYLFTRFIHYLAQDSQTLEDILAEEHEVRATALREGRTNNNRKRLLFLNHSLFGNIKNYGSCSMYYLKHNTNASFTNTLKIEYIFKKLQLNDIYDRYKQDITQLQQQFMSLNNQGNLLQVAVTPAALKECVYLAHIGGAKRTLTVEGKETDDIRQIMDTLYHTPYKPVDKLEFCLILTGDYALKPNNGIEIFAFNTVPADKWQEYCAQRDALLQKIARELAH